MPDVGNAAQIRASRMRQTNQSEFVDTSRRSHLALDEADPDFGAQYSVESLRTRSRSVGVPSALHGAPETAEVLALHLLPAEPCYFQVGEVHEGEILFVARCILDDSICVMQESRVTLDRLRRMAGFESQDFDPAVRVCCVVWQMRL